MSKRPPPPPPGEWKSPSVRDVEEMTDTGPFWASLALVSILVVGLAVAAAVEFTSPDQTGSREFLGHRPCTLRDSVLLLPARHHAYFVTCPDGPDPEWIDRSE